MDMKKYTMMYMKRYVRDAMMMRQALIFEGLSEDELDEAIREESVKSMKEYGAMTKWNFISRPSWRNWKSHYKKSTHPKRSRR